MKIGKNLLLGAVALMSIANVATAKGATDANVAVEWDATSLIIDGKRVVPVMAEVHYSRIPAEEWEAEVKKMKDGGVTIIATYVFWNHHEEVLGQYDWSGQRDLRRFIEICKEQELPVVLRMGPFCHGEVRNGGIPDFVLDDGCKTRSEDPRFLEHAARLYRQIYAQIQGLQWKDGGPIVAAQFDNEYRGRGSYLMALKKIANEIGIDLPFYTRTGWPELATPVPYGEMIPLYGDYADGFWDRSIQPTAGTYYKAFNFKNFRSSDAIASEQLDAASLKNISDTQEYPYFTCELGGGMTCAYHRRPYIYPMDAYAMAVVKLGSGSNLLGYYMYHGGTNPDGRYSTLEENQGTKATNYNDMMVKSYEFQAPLGEFGQRNPHYYMLRPLHIFMADYGERLAPMTPVFVTPQEIEKGADALRVAYRTDGEGAFLFINNYERLQNLTDKKKQQWEVLGQKVPSRPITVPAGTACIFPVNIDGIDYATAQIVAKRDGKIYMAQVPGIPTEIKTGGKVLRNVTTLGADTPVTGNIHLLTWEDAQRLFLDEAAPAAEVATLAYAKQKEAAGPRDIKTGARGVAAAPTDADFEAAAVYTIDLPADRDGRLLNIDYRGDCARLYADGRLIGDNYYNGRQFCYGLWRVPSDIHTLELRILPLQPSMPVYFPDEADTSVMGESVVSITSVPM